MMKVLCVGYRDWALDIYKELGKTKCCEVIISGVSGEQDYLYIDTLKPDLILFYGWSSIIPSFVLEAYTCLMLHPSKLPGFKGGSPIQNQIIRGVKDSAITIFKMTEKLDSGPIARQADMSLDGDIDDIFSRIKDIGLELTIDIIKNGLHLYDQKEWDEPLYKRRTPSESEITIEEIQSKTSIYLFNKIRMLTGPTPRAYIKTMDGKKLFIEKAWIDE